MTLKRSQPVVIRLPGADPLPARVEAVDADGVTLVLSVPPEPGAPAVAGVGAVIEAATPTGIHRVSGRIERAGDDPSIVRLVRSGAEVLQRREWARVETVVPVNVRLDDSSSDFAATVTLDLSGGGALIRDPVGLPPGTPVQLELHLDAAPMRVGARVARAREDGLTGLSLEEISESDRERIVRYVMARQRAEMRLRRQQS